jgi:hypothetical protein
MTKNWFFEKTKKIDKPLSRLTKKKKEYITNNSNETLSITTNPVHIKLAERVLQIILCP